jgi:hypothetical protein
LFVPALVYEAGDRVWWPTKLAARRSQTAAAHKRDVLDDDRGT